MAMPPLSPIRNIPVGRTAWQAYRMEVRFFVPILKALVFPIILLLGLVTMYGLAVILGSGIVAGIVLITFLVLQYVPVTFLAVAVSRIILVGPDTYTPVLVPKWQRRHWRFFGYIMFFLLVFSLCGAMFVVVGATQVDFKSTADPSGVIVYIPASAAALIASLYALLRFCFIFPAVAVDETYKLRDCWRLGRRQSLRILMAIFIASIPALVIHIMAVVVFVTLVDPGKIFSPPNSEWRNIENVVVLCLFMLVMGAIGCLYIVAAITPISIAFRTCAGWSPDPSPAVPPGGSNPVAKS